MNGIGLMDQQVHDRNNLNSKLSSVDIQQQSEEISELKDLVKSLTEAYKRQQVEIEQLKESIRQTQNRGEVVAQELTFVEDDG